MQDNRQDVHCEELFVVKHKSRYSCESAIYFNITTEIIKENSNFDFYYNKSDIIPTILDGGNEIILANWPNDKHIICNINNLVEAWYSLEQYIGLKEDKLSSTYCGLHQV